MSKSYEFQPCPFGTEMINWPLSTRTEGLVPDVDEGLGWSSEEVRRRLVNTDQALPLCSHGVTYGTGNTAVISEIVSSSIQTERTAVPAPRTQCQAQCPVPGQHPTSGTHYYLRWWISISEK